MKLQLPWSVAFVRRMAPHVTLRSALRLRKAVLGQGPELVPVRVKRPFRADVWLRKAGTDLSTFREVVRQAIYRTAAVRAAPCEYVLDLGANIGLTSLYLASLFPTCRILAVEPSAENGTVLGRNLAHLVAVGRCRICSGAVWGEDTTVDLGHPPGGVGYDAIQVDAAGKAGAGCPVPAYTVATLIRMAGFPRVDLVKIDIEGAETEVFRGPTRWLDRVNAIVVEFHCDSRRESGFDAVAASAGFRVEEDRAANTLVAFRPAERRVV